MVFNIFSVSLIILFSLTSGQTKAYVYRDGMAFHKIINNSVINNKKIITYQHYFEGWADSQAFDDPEHHVGIRKRTCTIYGTQFLRYSKTCIVDVRPLGEPAPEKKSLSTFQCLDLKLRQTAHKRNTSIEEPTKPCLDDGCVRLGINKYYESYDYAQDNLLDRAWIHSFSEGEKLSQLKISDEKSNKSCTLIPFSIRKYCRESRNCQANIKKGCLTAYNVTALNHLEKMIKENQDEHIDLYISISSAIDLNDQLRIKDEDVIIGGSFRWKDWEVIHNYSPNVKSAAYNKLQTQKYERVLQKRNLRYKKIFIRNIKIEKKHSFNKKNNYKIVTNHQKFTEHQSNIQLPSGHLLPNLNPLNWQPKNIDPEHKLYPKLSNLYQKNLDLRKIVDPNSTVKNTLLDIGFSYAVLADETHNQYPDDPTFTQDLINLGQKATNLVSEFLYGEASALIGAITGTDIDGVKMSLIERGFNLVTLVPLFKSPLMAVRLGRMAKWSAIIEKRLPNIKILKHYSDLIKKLDTFGRSFGYRCAAINCPEGKIFNKFMDSAGKLGVKSKEGIKDLIDLSKRILGKNTDKFDDLRKIYKGKMTRYGPMKRGDLHNIPSGSGTVADTFRSSSYFKTTLDEPVKLYRVYGEGARPISKYWSRTKPSGPLQATFDSALDPTWGNSAKKWVEITVPKGEVFFEGTVSKVALKRGSRSISTGELLGGGSQVYINKRAIPKTWISSKGDF